MFGFEGRHGADSTTRFLVNGTSEREKHHKKPESVSRRITYSQFLDTSVCTKTLAMRQIDSPRIFMLVILFDINWTSLSSLKP
jgi:hypothetical protein